MTSLAAAMMFKLETDLKCCVLLLQDAEQYYAHPYPWDIIDNFELLRELLCYSHLLWRSLLLSLPPRYNCERLTTSIDEKLVSSTTYLRTDLPAGEMPVRTSWYLYSWHAGAVWHGCNKHSRLPLRYQSWVSYVFVAERCYQAPQLER